MSAQYLLENVSDRYKLGSQFIDALCGIELEIRQGEFLAIAGPSGSGKTTLLKLTRPARPAMGRHHPLQRQRHLELERA